MLKAFVRLSNATCGWPLQTRGNVAQKTRRDNGTASSFRNSSRYPVSLPEVVSLDVLGAMLDEDLIARLRALSEGVRAVFESGLDLRPWETEIAYVRREMQLREGRRGRHERWLREEAQAFARAEVGLPPGDFDNSAFVYAATGGRPRWN